MSDDLKEVLEKLDIGSYLDREGIEYRESHGSSGAQLNVRECPTCGGSKWKVFLNAESGLGNCFHGSCEAKFNKFSFIRAHTSLAGRELVEHIKVVGAEMGWRPPRKSVKTTTRGTLELPATFPIPTNGRNLTYLENRGITIPIAQYFGLRFCARGKFWYVQDGEARCQVYDNRVIIPVFDIDGNLVSFQGRDITGTAEKKYLFPNGFASTGEHLFNAHNVVDCRHVLVGEGAFDVAAQKIALDGDLELRDVVPVGTFGKHVALNQLARFRTLRERGVTHVTFMWDGEPQAVRDAVTAGLQLVGIGMKVRIAILPDGKDPNEVPAEVVRRAFYTAQALTKATAPKILLNYARER